MWYAKVKKNAAFLLTLALLTIKQTISLIYCLFVSSAAAPGSHTAILCGVFMTLIPKTR